MGCQVQKQIQCCCWMSHPWKDPAKQDNFSPNPLSANSYQSKQILFCQIVLSSSNTLLHMLTVPDIHTVKCNNYCHWSLINAQDKHNLLLYTTGRHEQHGWLILQIVGGGSNMSKLSPCCLLRHLFCFMGCSEHSSLQEMLA